MKTRKLLRGGEKVITILLILAVSNVYDLGVQYRGGCSNIGKQARRKSVNRSVASNNNSQGGRANYSVKKQPTTILTLAIDNSNTHSKTR